MLRFKCQMDMDNDAFAQDPHIELACILKKIANDMRGIDDTDLHKSIKDTNGNKVGELRIVTIAEKEKLIWGQERTEEILDYWLGDAANKQARENLFYECERDPEVLQDVLDFWEESAE